MNNRRLARGAMLIALALALQAVRLVLPLPQPVSTFVIGSLVHMMLDLEAQRSGHSLAAGSAAAAYGISAGAGAAAAAHSCHLGRKCAVRGAAAAVFR